MNVSQEIRDFDPKQIYKTHFKSGQNDKDCQICKKYNQDHLNLFASCFCALLLYEKSSFIFKNTPNALEGMEPNLDQQMVLKEINKSFKQLKICHLIEDEIDIYQTVFDKHIFRDQIPKQLSVIITKEIMDIQTSEESEEPKENIKVDHNKQAFLQTEETTISQEFLNFNPWQIYTDHVTNINDACQRCQNLDQKKLKVFAEFFCSIFSYFKDKFLFEKTNQSKESEMVKSSLQKLESNSVKIDTWEAEDVENYLDLFRNHIFKNQIPEELIEESAEFFYNAGLSNNSPKETEVMENDFDPQEITQAIEASLAEVEISKEPKVYEENMRPDLCKPESLKEEIRDLEKQYLVLNDNVGKLVQLNKELDPTKTLNRRA